MNVPVVDSDVYYNICPMQNQGKDDNTLKAYQMAEIESVRYMELNKISSNAQTVIEDTIDLLEGYKDSLRPVTAYYPAEVLLNYVRSLNKQLEYMYANRDESGDLILLPDSRIGRYRDLWIYKGDEGSLVPGVLEFGGLYEANGSLNSALATGFENVADRWDMNTVKTLMTANAVMGAALAFGSGTAAAGAGLVSSMAASIGDSLVAPWENALNNADRDNASRVGNAIANLYINTGFAAAKQFEAATSVNSVFKAVDEWRKIDPPIPVTVLGIDMTDVVVPDDEDFGFGKVVITVRNDHTGTIAVAPKIQVMDGNGIIDTASVGHEMIRPGESMSFTADIAAPKATLRDPAGFNMYVSFELSEPGSMSIADCTVLM